MALDVSKQTEVLPLDGDVYTANIYRGYLLWYVRVCVCVHSIKSVDSLNEGYTFNITVQTYT